MLENARAGAQTILTTARETTTGASAIVNIIPSNVFTAAAENTILSVMFFALVFGIGMVVTDTPASHQLRGAIEGHAPAGELDAAVRGQVDRMAEIVDYQLRRASTAGRGALAAVPVAVVARKLVDALHKAYFEDGRNIGDLDVLVDIARNSGLDGDALRQALTERRYTDLVDEGIQWAAESGLTSTPTFVFDDRLAIVGAQDYDLFESVMERLGVKRRTMNDE